MFIIIVIIEGPGQVGLISDFPIYICIFFIKYTLNILSHNIHLVRCINLKCTVQRIFTGCMHPSNHHLDQDVISTCVWCMHVCVFMWCGKKHIT